MQNFEYENIEVINDLIKELNVLLKRENSLQDSINKSIDTLNDYTTLQEIKQIMDDTDQVELKYEDQKNFKNLLISDNIFLLLNEQYPSIFQEINLNKEDLVGLSVEQQHTVLTQLLLKVTKDNNKLVDYLQQQQCDETLVCVNKFKVFINNQYSKFLYEIQNHYGDHVFPMEDLLNQSVGVNSINNLTSLKKIHLILNDIQNSLQ